MYYHSMDLPWYLDSESLIDIIPLRRPTLALSVGFDMLESCNIIMVEAPSHTIVEDPFLKLWRDQTVRKAVISIIIPKKSLLYVSEVPLSCLGDMPASIHVTKLFEDYIIQAADSTIGSLYFRKEPSLTIMSTSDLVAYGISSDYLVNK